MSQVEIEPSRSRGGEGAARHARLCLVTMPRTPRGTSDDDEDGGNPAEEQKKALAKGSRATNARGDDAPPPATRRRPRGKRGDDERAKAEAEESSRSWSAARVRQCCDMAKSTTARTRDPTIALMQMAYGQPISL